MVNDRQHSGLLSRTGRQSSTLILAFVIASTSSYPFLQLSIIWEEWRGSPRQRIWLIFGLAYYIVALMKHGWFVLERLLDRTIYIATFRAEADLLTWQFFFRISPFTFACMSIVFFGYPMAFRILRFRRMYEFWELFRILRILVILWRS